MLKALPIKEHGDARNDLRDFFVTVVQIATTDSGKILPPLIAEAVHNAELRRSFQQRYLKPRREEAIAMAQHAIDRGEIADDADPSLFYDMLGGYIWFRRLVIGVPITAEEADAAVSALLDGTRARRGSRRKTS